MMWSAGNPVSPVRLKRGSRKGTGRGGGTRTVIEILQFRFGHVGKVFCRADRYLLSLAADDEPAGDLLGSEAKSAFSALFQEKDKMAAWNAFLAFNEDDQFAILANDEIFASINNEAVLENYSSPAIEKVRNLKEARRKLPASEAFSSLCPKLRSIFSKRHFPMVNKLSYTSDSIKYPKFIVIKIFSGNINTVGR